MEPVLFRQHPFPDDVNTSREATRQPGARQFVVWLFLTPYSRRNRSVVPTLVYVVNVWVAAQY